MLKIGYFSKLSRISVRMLRHYDDIGLLKPKVVDKWTGYRYYDEAQLIAAGKIQMLKDLGFGLSMIKELLADSEDSDKIGNLLKAKQKDLITEESELREQIKLIDNAIKNLKKEGDFMTSITATKARENIYQLIQDVNTSCTPVTITNSRGKNAVLIGEEDWNAIEETLYLMSVPGMTESIIEGGNTDISECLDESEVEW